MELEGLAKSCDANDSHSVTVHNRCHEALSWLRDRPQNTKCVTSKGSVLNSFSLAFEEDCSDGQVGKFLGSFGKELGFLGVLSLGLGNCLYYTGKKT